MLKLSVFLIFVYLSESATIHKKNDTLEILKKDVADVGSAIENFTFDVLRDIIEDYEDEETTTVESQRRKRSVDDEIKQLCQKRCEEAQRIETQQIRDLKVEVKKFQEMVKLLQDQQKIIDILNHENRTSTKQTRTQREPEDNENAPNVEELAKMKTDLKEVINDLNRTRELINLQKKKDEILEGELKKQKEEIGELRNVVNLILHKNATLNATVVGKNATDNEVNEDKARASSKAGSRPRASELTEIRKLLKALPEDEDDDDDLDTKLSDLKKHLSKKRKQQSILSELKALEKSLDDEPPKTDNSELMKQLIGALKKNEPKGRDDNLDVTSLSDLQDAINRLRPKQEDTSSQFQAMLSSLITRPTNQRPQLQFGVTPQQMSELTKKLTPNNYPPICVVDDKSSYRAPANSPKFQFAPPVDYTKGQQFFPGQFTQPSYYPQGNANGAGVEKPLAYQGENGEYDQKYQEDLKQQIEGLQSAIDSLNKPEYVQKPEDKAVIDDLERQIGDLRGIVDNLNYDQGYAARTKRSLDNNEVEDGKEVVETVKKLVGKILDDDGSKTQLVDLQGKIDTIKNRLDGGASKLRAAQYYDPPPPIYTSDLTNPAVKDLTRSFKGDFLADIIGKILEKLISALPAIIQRLFSFGIEELSKYDPQDYDVQVLYKNLGIFATLPVVLLRLLKGVAVFMNMLRKNSFFKNFLLPAIILGTVAGSVLFLIWWLQPDDTNASYNYVTDQSDQNYNNQYSTTNQPVSYNYPVYNRSYFNK